MYANKNVLVTGGTGLIGRPLVELLLQSGANVRVASLDDESLCPEGAEFVRGNLMHWDFCQRKAKTILGFKAKTELKDGIKKTIEWCRENS